MKKLLFTFLALMVLCTSAWGATTTATKTTVSYGWANNSVHQQVTLDNQITVNTYTGKNGTISGTSTNKNNMWYVYQDVDNGRFTIDAKSGYWIKSMKLTYSMHSSNGVLCYQTGTSLTTDKQIVSGTPYNVNKTSETIYVGNSGTGTKGMVRITDFEVIYGAIATEVAMDANKTVFEGEILQIGVPTPIDAYCIWSSSDNSKVSVDEYGIITAKAVGTATIKVKSNSFEKTCTVTVVAGGGGNSWTETFSKAEFFGSNTTKNVDGDSAVYNWAFTSVMREDKASYKVDGKQGIYLRYNKTTNGASVASRGNFEGGIKTVAFKWKPANASNVVHYMVNVGGTNYEYYNGAQASTWYGYQREVGVKSNTSFSISLDIQRTPQQAYMYFSPITITPYLLYTVKSAEWKKEDGVYKNTALINNTTGDPVVYSLEDNDGEASIDASTGEVTILNEGQVTVKASWGDVYTTYTLITHVKPIPTVTYDDVEKNMNDAAFTNPMKEEITDLGTAHYTSSDKAVIQVDEASGLVTIVGAGVANINVHFDENTTWAAADASYQVTVIDPMEDAVIEDFNDAKFGASEKAATLDGKLATWEYQYARRRYSGNNDFDTLQNGSHATWLNYVEAAHLLTTDELEGGIKRVSFLWNRISTGDRIVEFVVSAGDDLQTKDTVTRAINQSVARLTPDIVYNHNFFIKKNSKLNINGTGKKDNKESYMVVGDIKITPYLLYTTKVADMYAIDGDYTHPIINNTNGEGTITYSLEGEGADQIASIDSETGEVTAKKDGQVTVKATWGDVTTTYTLNVHMANTGAQFAAAVVNKNIGDGTFTNELTKITPAAASYSSSDESVATVDAASGLVTIINGGTTQIKATLASSQGYRDTTLFYTLDVYDTPVEGTYWVEGFDSVAVGTSITTAITPNGNMGVYKWSLTNLQRQNPSDLIDGQQGMRLRWPSVWTMVNPEGGIKEVAFDWYATAHNSLVHFFVKAGENEYEYKRVAVGVSKQTMHFAHQFNEAQNSALSFYMSGAEETPQQTYAVIGPVKIVPYLLYTVKSAEWKKDDGVYKNTALINNTTGDPVVYSLEDNDGEASIDTSTGEVTILNEGQVTVKASWGDVYTTYTLITHAKPIPTVTFDDVEKDMNDSAFTNPMKEEIEGLGTPHYTSSDKAVVTVNEASGLVTIVGEGNATINVHFDESTTLAAADAGYKVTITDPMEGAVTENFKDATLPAKETPQTTVGALATWEYQFARRRYSGTNTPDTLVGGAHATWFNVRDTAYIKTTGVMEGGIKRVSFKWNKQSPNTRTAKFYINAGETQDMVEKVITAGKDVRQVNPNFEYNHNFFVKENVAFSIYNTQQTSAVQSYILVGDIKITPYLLYTTKKDTLDMKAKKTYQMVPQIDNRDDEVAIQYSIIAGNENNIAQIAADGTVTANASGTITVQAAWSGVTTTYQLTILADKTTIYLVRNDGTENVDTIVNNRDEVAPTITLPTREGYQFNAYWTKPDTAAGSYRFTVTTAAGATVWVANRTINMEKVTGENRIWIYTGSQYTLYADWRTERTITLDNQEATEAGTDKVVTAYCPNNNMLRLNTSITCPTKTGMVFQGYYTEEDGQGAQLIDATGAFKASVAGYTDKDRWFIKDADITLYAYWVENALIIDEEDTDLAQKIADNDGKSAKVTLRRAMTADGTYNTIYLPFALTEEQVTTVFGTGATVAELKSSSLDGNVLSLNFDFVTATEAGKPYLVAPTQNVTEVNVGQVAISKDEQTGTCEGGNFHGILEAQNITMADKYFLGNENKLITYTAITDYDTKGLRAYFTLNNPAPGVQARCVIGRGTTTVLPFINGEAVSGTKKIIKDNQLIIIRDGKLYNAQGALMR